MTHFNKLNEIYNGFKVTRIVPLPELQCTMRELVHVKTGAKVLHIENDDPENVFCLSFQTLPYSSNGVAHILEHTVLCGYGPLHLSCMEAFEKRGKTHFPG